MSRHFTPNTTIVVVVVVVVANLYVRLSVCLSVRNVPVSDENGLTYRHSFFSPYSSMVKKL